MKMVRSTLSVYSLCMTVALTSTTCVQISFAENAKNIPHQQASPTNQASQDNISKITKNIQGFFQLGTDHVWRGISFSSHTPEIFGSMLYVSPVGIYGGVISYNTLLSTGGLSVVPIVGVKGEVDDFTYDLSARYEDYPKYNTLVTPDIFEAYGEIGYALAKFLKISGGVGYSPNYYFKSGSGIYTSTGAFVTLPKRISIDAGLGYQTTSKGGEPNNLWFKDYLNWSAGIAKDFDYNFKFGFRYTQTNLNNADCHDLNICGPAYNVYARKSF